VTTDRHNTASDRHPARTAALLCITAIAAAIATAALVVPDPWRIAAIAGLALLTPAAYIAGSRVADRGHHRQDEQLSRLADAERAARQRQTDGYAELLGMLSASLGTIRDFAGRIANPGFSDVAEAEALFALMTAGAADAVRQIDTMAVAARIDSGTYRPELSIVDLDRRVVHAVESTGRPMLKVSFDVQPAAVLADPRALDLAVLGILATAADRGATRARVGVEERNGLGILSIVDDRRDQSVRDGAPENLVSVGRSLPLETARALVEHQGGTMSEGLTLDWYSTTVRIPVATRAQIESRPSRHLADRIV
jgi:hypothetical protein